MPDESLEPLEALRRARRELDDVIDEIRRVEGFQDFLAPPTFDDVLDAARDRPLVFVTAAEPGGLALSVRDGDVTHVPLEELTLDAVREQVTPYLDAYAAYRDDPAAGIDAWRRELDTITRWLWGAVIGPLLASTERTDEMTLVAGGLLGLLPLHAAWTPDADAPTGRRYTLDEVVVSYAPNARAISAARAVARSTTASRLLVVVDPRPVEAPGLPAACIEGVAAAAAFPDAATVIAHGEATTGAFRREVQRADVLHLACHGVAHLDAPLRSGLLLAGNRWVTLRDLFGMSVRARLAVLSACETSLPGTELPDEVIALPTGLLQAGVAGVIASQWAVPDLGTAILMTDFYRRRGDASPAVALRDAQQWLRDTTNGEKLAEWERALDRGATWLPDEVADALLSGLAFREPAVRDHAELRAWAGFAHVGI